MGGYLELLNVSHPQYSDCFVRPAAFSAAVSCRLGAATAGDIPSKLCILFGCGVPLPPLGSALGAGCEPCRSGSDLNLLGAPFELASHDIIYAERAPCESVLIIAEGAVNFAEYFRQCGHRRLKSPHASHS